MYAFKISNMKFSCSLKNFAIQIRWVLFFDVQIVVLTLIFKELFFLKIRSPIKGP